MIWAVVVAAGESRRMGTQKLLLPLGDETDVGAVMRAAGAPGVDRVFKSTQCRYRITCQHGEIYVAVRTGAPLCL